MTQTFTLNHNDVIRYLYNETTPQENELITEALLFDTEMLDFYLDLVDLKEGLNGVKMTPPQRVVDGILAFSEQYEPEA